MGKTTKTSAASAPSDTWGGSCTAWRLLQGGDLAVAEELMPPGTREVHHRHARARQFFYVLSGRLTMAQEGAIEHLGAGEGIEIAPGVPHQAINDGTEPVRFLVVSAPTTKGDRENLG